MQMVSFLWGGDVTSHILIMLDRLAGVSALHDKLIKTAQALTNHLRLLSPDESFETA